MMHERGDPERERGKEKLLKREKRKTMRASEEGREMKEGIEIMT